jgi:hypothetical protein
MLFRKQDVLPLSGLNKERVLLMGKPSLPSREKRGIPQKKVSTVLHIGMQGREADRSPPSSADVMNTGAITSTPPCIFMARLVEAL